MCCLQSVWKIDKYQTNNHLQAINFNEKFNVLLAGVFTTFKATIQHTSFKFYLSQISIIYTLQKIFIFI